MKKSSENNVKFLKEVLQKNKNKNNVAFFIGNGINRYYNFRDNNKYSWENFLLDLYKDLYKNDSLEIIPKGISFTEFYDIIELKLLKDKINNKKTKNSIKKSLQKKIKEKMGKWEPGNKKNKVLDFIKKLDSPILTTNFDDLIPKYFNNKSFNSRDKLKFYKITIDIDINKFEILKKFLEKIKESKKQYVSNIIRNNPISEKKVKEFKNNFIKNFNENSTLRNILKDFNLYQEKINENYKDKKGIGVNILMDKSLFFDNDKNLPFITIGLKQNAQQLGKNFTDKEHSIIVNNLIEKSKKINIDNLNENIINKKIQILIAINMGIWDFFNDKNNTFFIPNWTEEFSKYRNYKNKKYIAGIYKINNIKLAVYQIYSRYLDNMILLVNNKKFGKLNQYIPEKNYDNNILENNIFNMEIIDFTYKNLDELKKYIDNISWIKEKGDEQQQLNYLKENVLIKISEKFEFIIDKDFEGYYTIKK